MTRPQPDPHGLFSLGFQAPIVGPSVPADSPPSLDAALAAAMAELPAAGRLLVLVNDPQRHTDSAALLDLLTRRSRPQNVRVLVACGTHSFQPAAKQAFEAGIRAAAPAAEIAWHDCRAELVSIGGAWRGHPWLLQAERILAIGSVEPHYFAGFTGAHKTATVGVASHDDIERNHAHALLPACRPCRLAGNPVYEGIAGMLAALEAQRPLAAVNLVQAGQRVLASAAGKAIDALHLAAAAAEKCFVRIADAPADGIVLDVAGPLGRSFYQADKGIKNNEWAVRDRGCLVLAAACSEGIGQDHFVALLRQAATHAQADAIVRGRGYRLGDHKATRLRYLTDPACRGVRVFVVSPGLSDADASVLGMTKAPTVAAAIAAAGLSPSRHAVCQVADAGNFCLSLERPAA